jgi:excisionase family DNA binding protein
MEKILLSDSELTESKFFQNKIEWMTSEEAAQYLRRSVGQIRNMVYRGQIKFRKFNSRLYFRKTELDRAIEISNKGEFNGNK